jgi:hypothetical protein
MMTRSCLQHSAHSWQLICFKRDIFEHEEYRETNTVIDNYFNDEKAYAYFALTGLGAYLIADNLRPEYRKSFLRFLCIVQIGVTNNNASIGIGFSF